MNVKIFLDIETMGTAQPMTWPPLHKAPLEFPLTLDIPEGCGEFIAGRIGSTPGRERPDLAMTQSLKERLLESPTSLLILGDDELELMHRATKWLQSRCMFPGKKRNGVISVYNAVHQLLHYGYVTATLYGKQADYYIVYDVTNFRK